MTPTPYHIPALLKPTISGLNIDPKGAYADVTFGGGGHSRAILENLGPDGKLFGFDRDIDALVNVPDDLRFTFVHSNFRFITNFMRYHGVDLLDGILADLGVSFHHFDSAERGFSFRTDAPLDMRMNRNASVSAKEIVSTYSAENLEQILRLYTDLRRPRAVADAIVKSRQKGDIDTTFKLADAVRHILSPKSEKKELAQVFQAFRIEVNGEMDSLRQFLLSTTSILKEGGRLAIITYHSIEDRIVKNFLKTGNLEGKENKDFFGRSASPWKLITRSPITPSEEEIENNPRSRSAKLRIAELLLKN